MNTASEFKTKISGIYKYRIELHAHTAPISRCSQIEPEEMVKIYSEKGYDAVVITNHFTYDEVEFCGLDKDAFLKRYTDNYEEVKAHGEKYGINVFLGAEIRFAENHNDYLLYGVNTEVLSKCYDYLLKGIEAFRTEVTLPDTVFLQAHPFRDGMEAVDPKLLDGIEILNMHPGHNSRVGIATRYAYESNLSIKTIGSDFHHKNHGHEAVSALRTSVMPKDSFELAKILRSGDYLFEVGENSIVIP